MISGRLDGTSGMPPESFDGLVLLFHTAAKPERAARLHRADCPMVRTSKRGGVVRAIREDLAYEVADLTERGFPVLRCKCCK